MAIRFGVIFIDNNIDNFFNDRRKTKQQLIRSILERKSGLDFIRFIEATASYTNLERKRKLSFEECAVFYTDADFVRIEREITSFNELPQFLANFKFSKSTYGIDKAEFSLSSLSLENMTLIDNLFTLKRNIKNTFDRYSWHGYSKIPQEKRITQIKKQVSEECKVNPFFHSWRVSSAQNIKINEIANDLESDKIVGKKIISNALLSANYCFMDDKNLKDLKKLLSQDQINLINLSNVIVKLINQEVSLTENVNGINLTSAIIDKIEYHFRDNTTFHFIFNVSNNFLSGKSKLTIEVPRVALENIKLPDMKEICVNQWYINIFINILKYSIYEGSYIIDLHLIDD
ncbi:hypothetical protein JT070_06270 [Helicobacter pylori]|nr:hypothetical protein [Helicobacter pylori]